MLQRAFPSITTMLYEVRQGTGARSSENHLANLNISLLVTYSTSNYVIGSEKRDHFAPNAVFQTLTILTIHWLQASFVVYLQFRPSTD